jgi:Glyoxalase/Bleomycin resistance protein/Dioxygenase superfamily
MDVTHVFAGIPIVDRTAAIDWYGRLVGRPPDLLPNEQEAAWRLTDTGWLYVIVDSARAGSALNTLLVADLDGVLARLSEAGIDSEPARVIASGVRQAIVTDPDGNRLKLGEVAA